MKIPVACVNLTQIAVSKSCQLVQDVVQEQEFPAFLDHCDTNQKTDALPMESHLPKLRHLLLLRPEGPSVMAKL